MTQRDAATEVYDVVPYSCAIAGTTHLQWLITVRWKELGVRPHHRSLYGPLRDGYAIKAGSVIDQSTPRHTLSLYVGIQCPALSFSHVIDAVLR